MDPPVYSLTPFFPANFSFACWVVSLWIQWKETKEKTSAANKPWLCSRPLSNGFSTSQVHHLRRDSLWHFLLLLTELTFYSCSDLEEKSDDSNHFTYNVLLFVVEPSLGPPTSSNFRHWSVTFPTWRVTPELLAGSYKRDKCPNALLWLMKNQRDTRRAGLSVLQQK